MRLKVIFAIKKVKYSKCSISWLVDYCFRFLFPRIFFSRDFSSSPKDKRRKIPTVVFDYIFYFVKNVVIIDFYKSSMFWVLSIKKIFYF